ILFALLAGSYWRFNVQPRAAAQQPVDAVSVRGGCLAAGALLSIGMVTLASRKALAETHIALREGVLWPLLITALVMAGCSLFGLFIVRKPAELLDSLVRGPVLMVEGDVAYPQELPAP